MPWYLEAALARVGHLRAVMAEAAGFLTVAAELSAARPMGVRLGWTSGSGHFIAIVGLHDDGERRFISIGDPARGTVEEEWPEATGGYLGVGTWTHTYLSRP